MSRAVTESGKFLASMAAEHLAREQVERAAAVEFERANNAKFTATRRKLAKVPIVELPGGIVDARPRRMREGGK